MVRFVVDVAVEGVVETVISVVGTVIVGRLIVGNVDGKVIDVDELFDGELVEELEVDGAVVDDELLVVDPTSVRAPLEVVTCVSRSGTDTSGRSTPAVPGMVLDSSGAVDDGKTSVRAPSPGPITWRTATTANTASSASGASGASGAALLSIGSTRNAP